MRGIKKGRSPTNVSPPSQQSRSFVAARKALEGTLPTAAEPVNHARTAFDTMEKARLRERLLAEQVGICIYKADRSLRGIPVPSELRYEQHLGYTRYGEMYARSGPHRAALDAAIGTADAPGVLNLNAAAQRLVREGVLRGVRRALERDYPDRTATAQQRAAEASRLLQLRPLPAHISLQVAWLTGTIGARPV